MTDVRALATDGVVFVDGEVVVLERAHSPYEGSWVLPGGLVDPDETAREACAREIREEVDLDVRPLGLVGLYDDPGRDRRGNASVAFVCVPTDDGEPQPREEARRVRTVSPDDLPEMGFDHDQIVRDAIE